MVILPAVVTVGPTSVFEEIRKLIVPFLLVFTLTFLQASYDLHEDSTVPFGGYVRAVLSPSVVVTLYG